MKPHATKSAPIFNLIEPLEARIAPATIRIGAIGTQENATDTEYREVADLLDPNRGPRPSPFNALSFVDTSVATDQISLAVDPLRAADGNNTFYLRLTAGDEVDQYSSASNYKPLIVVKRGNVVAYFTDLNNNNEYDAGELTGLSLGANAYVDVLGDVNGDIVTNLNEHRTANRGDDTVEMSGLVSFQQGIGNLKVLGGGVSGSILSGGDIKSLTVARNVKSVLAGSAAAGATYDFFTGSAGGEGIGGSTVRVGRPGASITQALIFSLTDRLEAGRGGAGADGGSLSNIQITGDTDGFQLLAGAGGNGDVTVNKPNGGIGGTVRSIFITGVEDPSPNSPLAMVIKAGAGGDGVTTALGGAGGRAVNVFVGYEVVGSTIVKSGELGSDSVVIGSGAGGAGKIGGSAGAVSTVNVRVRTEDVSGDEIFVFGGLGGSSITPGGRAGAGGSVTNVDLRNQTLTPDSDILVLGGNGGTTVGNSVGSVGGSIQNLVVLGYDLQIVAGDGSDGRIGRDGGSVKNVNILPDEFILTRNLIINAGRGGNGSASNGGNGGVIDGVTATQVDVEAFLINSGIAANGGRGLGGVGGRGGSVANIAITDIDGDADVIEGTAEIRTGDGGSGRLGGGAGGIYGIVDIAAHALNLKATAGNGGNAELNGNGGAGGGFRVFNFVGESTVNGVDVSGMVQAGTGGNGVGSLKSGGVGGSASRVSLNFQGDATLMAGKGGDGQVTTIVGTPVRGGAPGAGGSIQSSGVFALSGSGTVLAGDAGTNGSRPANGGSIIGDPNPTSVNGVPTPTLLVGVRGNTNITVIAGDGTHGGSGGDIRDVTYGSTAALLLPTPAGTILVQAGNGSGEGLVAGRGGSISGINGAVGSAANLTTTLRAGDGGGGPDVRKSGDGGGVANISLSRGGGPGIVVTIQAGDAGDSPRAQLGGRGGGIRTVGISNIDDQTIVRSIAAGDGGDAYRAGGLGGSIVDVRVENHDIGVRTGETFGYNRMGGIFLGAGGSGIRAGLAGSLNGASADSIAAIVAGRGNVPGLAELVTNVYVNGGETQTLLQRNGALVFNSAFRLTFGADQTPLLPGGATAAEVKTALNALPGIASAGGVDVEVTPIGGYKVTFVQNGQRAAITGVEQVPVDVTETITGATVNGVATESNPGTRIFPVSEVRSGQDGLPILETVAGSSLFSTSEISQSVDGSNEVQQLDLRSLAVAPTGQFDLTFGGDTTAPLPSNASAADIANALNLLPAIAAIGAANGTGIGVTVEPSDSLPRVFNITLLSGIDEAPILGNFFVQEKQRLDIGTIAAFPTGKFTLTFLGVTTPQISVGATPAQVAAQLNALSTITTAGGVTVSSPILGTYDILFNTIGDKASVQSEAFVQELQTVTIGNFANLTPAQGQFTISFGDQETAPLAPNATPAQVQAALNALSGIQAAGNVTVTSGLQNTYSIQFGNVGEQVPLNAFGVQVESQNLNLANLTSVDTAEFTLHIDHFAKTDETVRGTSVPVPSATTRNGVVVDVITTTVANGTPNPNGSAEEQFLDLFPVLTFAGVTGEFYLEFPVGNTTLRTAFLPVLATAGQIDAALDAIVNGGVTVAPDATAPQAFSIVFNNPGNQPQITGVGGVRELQTLDTAQVAAIAGSNLVLKLGNDSTAPLAGNATAAQIETALDALPGAATLPNFPGVTVTQTNPNRFNVLFNDFADVPQLSGEGGGTANREAVRLDLSQFAGVANTTFTLNFETGTTAVLPVTATAAQIETALNALPEIKSIRSDNTGAVTVTTVSPNVFSIVYNIFGNQTDLTGLLTKGTGTTTRLAYNSTPAQIEAALDLVSLVDTKVAAGATPGNYTVTYGEFGDQPAITTVGYIHEKQKVDVYQVGQFQLSFNNETTGVLPQNATPAQVQAALNALSTVQATAKPVVVTANADSSYSVVFGADNDQLPFGGIQFEDLTATTNTDGSGTAREIQFLTAIKKGEFNSLFFTASAKMLGAIADINEIDSNVFKSFVDADGNGIFSAGDTLHVGNFVLGDVPIDGIVMAKRFDQTKTNVTPEAKFTASGFFDNDNLI